MRNHPPELHFTSRSPSHAIRRAFVVCRYVQGPIPHYSPACKASPSVVPRPLSTIKSAAKEPRSPGTSARKSRRRSSAGTYASTPGDARPTAPANTPATGRLVPSAVRLLEGLEGYAANIAQTPGGHAKHGAVARILAMEEAVASEAGVDVTMEEEIDGALGFVEAAEAAAAAEAAEAAADAGAAAAEELGEMHTEEFDEELFAMDAQLAAEGVADVEAAVEIEAALEAACAKTTDKVAEWLETNLAAAVAAAADTPKSSMSAKSARRSSGRRSSAVAATTPQSEGLPLPIDSPVTELVKARGGSAGGRAYGGLSARVAQLHRALRATRMALVRERQRSAHFQGLYKEAMKEAKHAKAAAAAAAGEVAEATAAAAEAAAATAAAQSTAAEAAAAAAAAEAAVPAVALTLQVARTPPRPPAPETVTAETSMTPVPVKAGTPAKKSVTAGTSMTPAPAKKASTPVAVEAAGEREAGKEEVAEVKMAAVADESMPEDKEEQENEEQEDEDACKVCGCADERDALLCDGCDGAFHLGCLKPKLRKIPAGDWFCKECVAEKKAKEAPAPPKRGRATAKPTEKAEPTKAPARGRKRGEAAVDEEPAEASKPKRGRTAATAAAAPAEEPPAGRATRRSTRAR